MTAKSNYLENEILDHILGKGTRDFTSPVSLFMAISTADPSEDGSSLTEPNTSHGYARQAITFGAASGGATSNTGAISFGANTTTNWGTITHFAIMDGSSGGNMLYKGALTASKLIEVGDSLDFAIGEVDISED